MSWSAVNIGLMCQGVLYTLALGVRECCKHGPYVSKRVF